MKLNFFHYEILLSTYFITSRDDIVADNSANGLDEIAMGNSSNNNHGSENALKTISMEEYTRLVRDSVEFYKAKKTIETLTKRIEKKDATILEFKKKSKFGNLSPVSLRYF